jgi:hypothetical protein
MPFTGNLQYVLLLRSYSLSTLTISNDSITPLNPLNVHFTEELYSMFSCFTAILYQPLLSQMTYPVTPLNPLSVRFTEASQYVFLLRSYSLPTLTISGNSVIPLSPSSVHFTERLCSTFSCFAAILYQPLLSQVTCLLILS